MAGLVAATALVLATVSAAFARTQPAPGAGGMMGGNGQGNGPGMMGGTGRQGFPQATPLTSLSDAKAAFQQQSTGQGAFELLADPQTGAVFPEFGPTMMWNTAYGNMGAMGGMANMMGSTPGMMGAVRAGLARHMPTQVSKGAGRPRNPPAPAL